jgi:DNA-binding MarR family transcriptional regulator
VRHFEQRAAQTGITLTQAKVLVFLSRNEGTTQTRLAELADMDPMTLVRVLDRMEKDGWIERRPDPSDRRAYRLYVKPASDPVLAEINRIGDKARGEALTGVSAEEREQLVTLLGRIQTNLEALVAGPNNDAGKQAHGANGSGKPGSDKETKRRARRTPRATQTRRRKAAT